jgi:hypothetical protein
MYMSAVPLAVIAVKYPFGTNERISSVLGKIGMQFFALEPSPVGITQFDAAAAEVCAKDKKAVIVVERLMMRYWLPPKVALVTWIGVGAVAAAVNLAVLPSTVNALIPILYLLHYLINRFRNLPGVTIHPESSDDLCAIFLLMLKKRSN